MAPVEPENFLHFHVKETPLWALGDCAASDNFISLRVVKNLGLENEIKQHPGFAAIVRGTISYIGVLRVPAGLVGERETDGILEFYVAPSLVHDVVIGLPYLDRTKTLEEEYRYRLKAAPIMWNPTPVWVILLSISITLVLVCAILFLLVKVFTDIVPIIRICLIQHENSTRLRLRAKLIKDDGTTKLVEVIPDSACGLNYMPRRDADALGYSINTRFWHRKLVRNAAGQYFLMDGIVLGKIKIGENGKELGITWHICSGFDQYLLGFKFVSEHNVLGKQYDTEKTILPPCHAPELFLLTEQHGIFPHFFHWIWRGIRGKDAKTPGPFPNHKCCSLLMIPCRTRPFR
jgi:hypothetical protein